MVALIDIISPVTIGSDKITLTVDDGSLPLQTFKPITVNIDYTPAGTDGINVPLELVIQPESGDGGAGNGYFRDVYYRAAPDTITFTPSKANKYFILLKEMFHNRWQGRLIVDVAGDKFSDTIPRTRS
jgi:hypothetical protein